MNKKIVWIVVGLIVVVGVIAIANRQSVSPASKEAIKVGVAIPTTGIAAIVGENEKNGIELAVAEINKAGGIDGRPLQVIIEDDHTDPKQTVSAIQKLISADKVSALIGGTWDFLANAAIPVIDQQKIVMITPSALPDTLEKTSNFLFVTHSPVSLNESAITEFLKKTAGQKVAIISVNNLWGKAHLATFKKAVTASGKTLVKETIVPQFDNNDIQRELTLIKPLNPDVIITALNFGDSVTFLKKKADLGVSGKVLGDFHVLDGYKQGNISKELLSGVTIFVFSDPDSEFIKRYVQFYNKQPGTYADTAYDAVYVLKKAIENSDGKTDSESIIEGLRQITNYQGASGLIDFGKNNYPANKLPVLKMFNGNEFINVQN